MVFVGWLFAIKCVIGCLIIGISVYFSSPFCFVLHGKCIYNMFLWIYTKYANCYFISSMVEIGTVNSEGESVYCMENGIYGSYWYIYMRIYEKRKRNINTQKRTQFNPIFLSRNLLNFFCMFVFWLNFFCSFFLFATKLHHFY